jgi:hypothetical protein
MVDVRRSDGLDNRPEDPNEKNSTCPNCGESNTPMFTAPNIGAYSAMSPDFQKEVLKKRSEKHSFQEIRKQPEKWGDLGKEMARKDRIQSK